jgi:hypothetical protein
MVDTECVRTHLLKKRRATVAGVLGCGDHVASGWDRESTTNRRALVDRFESTLRDTGLFETLPTVLTECVEQAGATISAQPVAAPPYVVVASTGVLLRATLDGGRLVVTLQAFDVDQSGERPCYVRGPSGLESAVTVAFRTR